MAKLGPLAKSVCCAVVKGQLQRLVTYLYWVLLFTFLSPTEGVIGAGSVVDGAIVAASVGAVSLVLELELLDWEEFLLKEIF